METKLTLSMEKDLIERAKKYASKKNTSLSRLIKNYLLSLTDKDTDRSITPLVKSLSGVLDIQLIENDKKHYAGYLSEKYK